ncbi:MAG TPA: hypothetical protein VIH99_09660 [Bdellovibrionota bacterium]|jgi:hypothetical protein
MKFVSLFALLLASGPVLAADCELNTRNTTTVLLNSAEQLAKLRAMHMTDGQAVSCRQVEQGVKEFTFAFRTCGNCLPKKADLRVMQDERPSYADGPVKYTHEITEVR